MTDELDEKYKALRNQAVSRIMGKAGDIATAGQISMLLSELMRGKLNSSQTDEDEKKFLESLPEEDKKRFYALNRALQMLFDYIIDDLVSFFEEADREQVNKEVLAKEDIPESISELASLMPNTLSLLHEYANFYQIRIKCPNPNCPAPNRLVPLGELKVYKRGSEAIALHCQPNTEGRQVDPDTVWALFSQYAILKRKKKDEKEIELFYDNEIKENTLENADDNRKIIQALIEKGNLYFVPISNDYKDLANEFPRSIGALLSYFKDLKSVRIKCSACNAFVKLEDLKIVRIDPDLTVAVHDKCIPSVEEAGNDLGALADMLKDRAIISKTMYEARSETFLYEEVADVSGEAGKRENAEIMMRLLNAHMLAYQGEKNVERVS